MTPLEVLKQAVRAFKGLECKYCLIGGHAASLYRTAERFTKDVDFAVAASDIEKSKKCAVDCIKALRLKPILGFIPPASKEPRRNSVCMVSSDASPNTTKGIIDILLPELPWVTNAVARAQSNMIDLGFAAIPVITPEDLVVAKCYALRNSPDRFQDLDDIKEIFAGVSDFNWEYFKEQLKNLKLSVPEQVRKYAQPSFR
jgi:hypothetical protein